MKTLERTSKGVRLTMVVALLMLTMQAYSNTSYKEDLIFRDADSSYVVASLVYENDDLNKAASGLYAKSKSGLYYEEMEEDLRFEDWMLSAKHEFWANVKSDVEDEIELEDWMMDASLW